MRLPLKYHKKCTCAIFYTLYYFHKIENCFIIFTIVRRKTLLSCQVCNVFPVIQIVSVCFRYLTDFRIGDYSIRLPQWSNLFCFMKKRVIKNRTIWFQRKGEGGGWDDIKFWFILTCFKRTIEHAHSFEIDVTIFCSTFWAENHACGLIVTRD